MDNHIATFRGDSGQRTHVRVHIRSSDEEHNTHLMERAQLLGLIMEEQSS